MMLAITHVIASIVLSCKSNVQETDSVKSTDRPVQVINDMFVVQSDNGHVSMRVESRLMEHYDKDSISYDLFPKGISVYGYTPEGLLESVIIANAAKHTVPKRKNGDEVWAAFGNVVIHNVIKMETMETDTLYWDQTSKEIYTDCYVKMYSSDGFMQGYGMRSDDHASNSILHNAFNGYVRTIQDTTAVIIDSVNFIGPFCKK